MVNVFICVDFDRDYGCPVANLKHAVSKPIHLHHPELIKNPQRAISIQGTVEAFDLFIQYLSDEKLPTTFYFEARSINCFSDNYPEKTKLFDFPHFELGVHGYDHEDLTGEETGIKFTRYQEKEIIKTAKTNLEKLFSSKMLGFRAPYMRTTDNTTSILSDLGFVYDSSVYQESVGSIQPYFINHNLIEFPVIKTPKESSMKGMYTYLWPLFEGNRNIEDVIENYLHIAKNSKSKNSYISVNLHSWHFAYNIKQDRYLSKEEIVHNINNFEKLIKALQEVDEVVFSTPREWLKKYRQSLDVP